MKYAISAFICLGTYLLQGANLADNIFDFTGIAREFGVPAAFTLLIFLAFWKMLSRRDKVEQEYRTTLLNSQAVQEKSQSDQVVYLRGLLAEMQKQTANICKFTHIKEE